MQRKLLLLLSCMLMFSLPVLADNHTVTGTIVDEDRLPLPGVTVIIKGTTIGTTSNIDGQYLLNVGPQDTLRFTFIGFQPLDVYVDGRSLINVTMQTSAIILDDVVVVGYGIQTKASVVASIAQTSGDDLLKAGGVTNVSQALQGMLPGITSVSSTGKPGADVADLFIRGRASWQESAPLVLVDGIERDMNNVDPNDIETVSVLKDASATAVFGVKGANGVILITTKRGTKSPPEINFSSSIGAKRPTADMAFADYVTAMEMRNEALANDQRWNDQVPDAVIELWRQNIHQAGPYNDYFPQVDWWDMLVKDYGMQHNHNINVRGGTDFLRYFASFSYLNDGDIFQTTPTELYNPSFFYQRYNLRSNFDFSISPSTEVSVDLSGIVGYRNQPGYRGTTGFFRVFHRAGQNEFPVKYSDGEWATGPAGEGNMVADFDMGHRVFRSYQGYADAKVDQDLYFITEGLSFNASISFNSLSLHQSRVQRYNFDNFGEHFPVSYYRRFDLLAPQEDGTYPVINEMRWPHVEAQNPPPIAYYDEMMNGGHSRYLYYEMAFNYNRSFGNHHVTALGLFSRSIDEGLEANESVLIKIPERREDWVARVTYNWYERYLFEFNAAYNGSEKFAPGLRYGFFPSVSIGWRISEEPFVKDIAGDVLNNLRIRASYGTAGVDRGARRFTYIQQFVIGQHRQFGAITPTAYGPQYYEGPAANPNATWETSEKENIGVNIGLFNKLDIELDFFREQRTGILMEVWSPIWMGIDDPSGNVGETKNRGAEIVINWRDLVGPNFRYHISTGLAFNDNRIVYMGDGINMEAYRANEGKPIDWQARHLVHGYYSSLCDIFNYATPENTSTQSSLVPGDFMFIDYNADGVIDAQDGAAMNNVDYPLNTYSLTLGFGYKNFDINVMFYAVSNLSKDIDEYILWDFHRGDFGIYKAGPDVLERWTFDNAAQAIKPALHASSDVSNYSQRPSSFVYQDASYIRLKLVELSYTLSNPGRLGLKRLQIYANGNNLLTWTGLDSRMDPETRGAMVYPMIQRFNLGVRATY